MFNDYDFMMGLTDYAFLPVVISIVLVWLIGSRLGK